MRALIYTLPSAVATYEYMNRTFIALSNFAYAQVRGSSVLQVKATEIPFAWRVMVKALNMIPALQGTVKWC